MHGLLNQAIGLGVVVALSWALNRWFPRALGYNRALAICVWAALATTCWALAAGFIFSSHHLNAATPRDGYLAGSIFLLGGCVAAFFGSAAFVSHPDRHSTAGRHSR